MFFRSHPFASSLNILKGIKYSLINMTSCIICYAECHYFEFLSISLALHLAGSVVVAFLIALAVSITIVLIVEFQLLVFHTTFIFYVEFHYDETLSITLDVVLAVALAIAIAWVMVLVVDVVLPQLKSWL